MQCPICGETLPLSSKVCDACGHEYDGFFLTEEFDASTVRKSVTGQKPPRTPSALKPGRPPLERRTKFLIAAGVVLMVAVVALVVVFIPHGVSAPSKPDEAVLKYYQYLQKGNGDALMSLFESGFLPVATDKAAVKAALASNTYEVTPPTIKVLTNDNGVAIVAIQDVQVQVTPKSGGAPKALSLAAYLQSVPGTPAGTVALVKLHNNGSGWQIAGRPVGGWNPDNLWLIGELKVAQ
jgi:hypothetical protein